MLCITIFFVKKADGRHLIFARTLMAVSRSVRNLNSNSHPNQIQRQRKVTVLSERKWLSCRLEWVPTGRLLSIWYDLPWFTSISRNRQHNGNISALSVMCIDQTRWNNAESLYGLQFFIAVTCQTQYASKSANRFTSSINYLQTLIGSSLDCRQAKSVFISTDS